MLAIRCVGVYMHRSENLFDLARNPLKGLSTRSPTRLKVDEGRKVGEKTECQLTKEGRRERSAWDSYPEKDTVDSEKMKAGQSRDESAFLVALWTFHAKYTPAIDCKCTESCHINFPLLALGTKPKSVFVRLFFSSTLSVLFCEAVKKIVIPLVGNHWMNHWPWVVWF